MSIAEYIVRFYDLNKIMEIIINKKLAEIEFKKGLPLFQQEYMSEWSVRRLKDLLYEGRIKIPQDFKLDVQLSSVMSMQMNQHGRC